jgi:hypothetical protein
MLLESDLAKFRELFSEAQAGDFKAMHPIDALQTEKGLFPEEIFRLAKSLDIAVIVGDAKRIEAVAAGLIANQTSQNYFADFDQADCWRRAISWALQQPEIIELDGQYQDYNDRTQHVGKACKRLRAEGYKITIGAYGPQIADESQRAIVERIDGLVAHLGGVDVTSQVCRIVEDSGLICDGIWLLGNQVGSINNPSNPSFPVGWIFSLGLRHLGRHNNVRRPAIAWASICRLATDFVAAMNCQRYSQFEEIDVHPTNSWQILRDSLLWREIFVLPQAPQQVVPSLREAFNKLISDEEERQFDWRTKTAFDELEKLLIRCADNKLKIHKREQIIQNYPNLWKMGVGEIGKVNRDYTNPTNGGDRDQSDFLFFAGKNDSILTLPRAFFLEAFCQALFRQIWNKLQPERASELGSGLIN